MPQAGLGHTKKTTKDHQWLNQHPLKMLGTGPGSLQGATFRTLAALCITPCQSLFSVCLFLSFSL
jgi:hypothetical protein